MSSWPLFDVKEDTFVLSTNKDRKLMTKSLLTQHTSNGSTWNSLLIKSLPVPYSISDLSLLPTFLLTPTFLSRFQPSWGESASVPLIWGDLGHYRVPPWEITSLHQESDQVSDPSRPRLHRPWSQPPLPVTVVTGTPYSVESFTGHIPRISKSDGEE